MKLNALNVLFALFGVLVLQSCGGDKPQSIKIAVAANAEPLAKALAEAYQKEHTIAFEFITGSSGQLSAQIANGAPFDIFIAADEDYPNYLESLGRASSQPKVYAHGQLALLSIDSLVHFSQLRSEQIEKIAIANPDLAPYGKAAKVALERSGYWESLSPKLVYGENALQAGIFTVTKAVRLSLTARSTAMYIEQSQEADRLFYTLVDEALYPPIKQAALLLKKEEQNPQALAFYNFIFEQPASAIIKEHGYKLPN